MSQVLSKLKMVPRPGRGDTRLPGRAIHRQTLGLLMGCWRINQF